MSDKCFYRILFGILAVAVIVTIAHFIYAVYAYQHCSIIYFIGEEPWGT